MFNKKVNIYKLLNELKEQINKKKGTPYIYNLFTNVKGTENGKIYDKQFYTENLADEILKIIDSKGVKYSASEDLKGLYKYKFNVEDKDKVIDAINLYNIRQYDRKAPITDIQVIDNSYLEKYLYQENGGN